MTLDKIWKSFCMCGGFTSNEEEQQQQQQQQQLQLQRALESGSRFSETTVIVQPTTYMFPILDAVPLMVTVIAQASSAVLYQNMASKAYSGDHVVTGTPTGRRHPLIRNLLSLQDDARCDVMLEDMLGAVASGGSWKQVVRVPPPAMMDACSCDTMTDLEATSMAPRTLSILNHSHRTSMMGTADARARLHGSSLCGIPSQSGDENEVEAWHEVTAQPFLDPAGKMPAAMLVTQTVVTARMDTERALSHLNDVHLDMLVDIFPRHIIEFISSHGMGAVPRAMTQLTRGHFGVSIMFMDIVGFTPMANDAQPQEVMMMLNEMFAAMDALCEVHNVYKIETVGDSYVAATGLFEKDADGFMQSSVDADVADSAARMLAFAKGALARSKTVVMPCSSGKSLTVRIGIHTGPCVTGLIGTRMPKLGVFGDTMNTASRMESSCVPGHIQVSERTWDLVHTIDAWLPTGGIDVKGKGHMQTYLWGGEASTAYGNSTAAIPLRERSCVSAVEEGRGFSSFFESYRMSVIANSALASVAARTVSGEEPSRKTSKYEESSSNSIILLEGLLLPLSKERRALRIQTGDSNTL